MVLTCDAIGLFRVNNNFIFSEIPEPQTKSILKPKQKYREPEVILQINFINVQNMKKKKKKKINPGF